MSQPGPGMRAWPFVVSFGVVSLLADVVYEGARSITGPLLASLGASAVLVGAVTGVGEAAALILRLFSGPMADRTRRFWAWTIAGYTITVVTVPFLGLTGILAITCLLVIAERVGKAVRSPAKDTLLSHATAVTGRGRGFAVHEALDQVGAILGPLIVAGMLLSTHGRYGPSLAILAIPGILTLGVLIWLRVRVPAPQFYELTVDSRPTSPTERRHRFLLPLPASFWTYAVFTGLTMTGFATFGVLSFHMVTRHLIVTGLVPVIYAAAMAADAIVALAVGWLYDKAGHRVLLILPVLAAVVPLLAYTRSVPMVIAGALVWGGAVGVQESTLRATVADLVPAPRRATAYGLFAAVLGTGAFIGGTLAGWLYDVSIPILIITTIAVQAAAVIVYAIMSGIRKR